MKRLHELLASEKTISSEANKLIKETISTFADKTTFFDGQIRFYTPKEDGGETIPNQNIKLRASVVEKLKFINSILAKYFNLKTNKEIANMNATADLYYNGELLASSIPATALLALESSLITLKDIYKTIPTRDVSETWTFDETNKMHKGVTKLSETTVKTTGWETVVPATEKHPAQIKEISLMKVTGNWQTTPTSGRISTIEKAALLSNIDNMLIAVKQARSKANDAVVEERELGTKVIDAIFKSVITEQAVVDEEEIKKLNLI